MNRAQRPLTLFIVGVASLIAACSTGDLPQTRRSPQPSTVLFMCPAGGAKSVIAASYFNQLAEAEHMPYIAAAAAAGTPYEKVPDGVAQFLAKEGFHVASFKPRKVSAADLSSAARVVSLQCDLTQLDTRGAEIERWDDLPAGSDVATLAAAIRRHVEELVQQLKTR